MVTVITAMPTRPSWWCRRHGRCLTGVTSAAMIAATTGATGVAGDMSAPVAGKVGKDGQMSGSCDLKIGIVDFHDKFRADG